MCVRVLSTHRVWLIQALPLPRVLRPRTFYDRRKQVSEIESYLAVGVRTGPHVLPNEIRDCFSPHKNTHTHVRTYVSCIRLRRNDNNNIVIVILRRSTRSRNIIIKRRWFIRNRVRVRDRGKSKIKNNIYIFMYNNALLRKIIVYAERPFLFRDLNSYNSPRLWRASPRGIRVYTYIIYLTRTAKYIHVLHLFITVTVPGFRRSRYGKQSRTPVYRSFETITNRNVVSVHYKNSGYNWHNARKRFSISYV